MPRPLPDDLAAALRAARAVEDAAVTMDQWRRAVRPTGRLMLACSEAGWTSDQVGKVFGLSGVAVRNRVKVARAAGADTVGLVVPARPAPPVPLAEREWLTLAEAVEVTGARPDTIRAWRWMGLLPNSRRVNHSRVLMFRGDLERVLAGPRRGRCGVDRLALAAELAA